MFFGMAQDRSNETVSMCLHLRVLFPLVSATISFPGMLCLRKAQHDILRDTYLLCTNRHSLGGSRKAKASLEHTPELPKRREHYSWIEAVARCHLRQNSHWSQRSQNFTSVTATACSALGLPANTIRVLTVPAAFVLWTAGRNSETLHISNQILIRQLRNLKCCQTVRDSNLHPEVWCFALAHHAKTNLILTNFLSFRKTWL